ncbi:MAG: hydrolase [Acidimicrobiia bacterium]|nr:MAG: hydrolase [Acidimicrobiia bacterium]
MTIDLPDGPLSYRSSGSGPPLVCLHSLLAGPAAFQGIEDRFEGFTVVVPDLPGFGASAARPDIYAAADALVQAAKTTIGSPMTLLGNGLGGFVALAMAGRHPDSVDRLVLIGSGRCFTDQGREALARMGDAVTSGGMEAVVETALARMFSPGFLTANPGVAARWRGVLLELPVSGFVHACSVLTELDLTDLLDGISHPVLVLVGSEDQATPPAMAEDLVAHLTNGRLVRLDGLGHVPYLEDPDATLRPILAFLKGGTP